MNREHHKWYSDRLGREMEMLVYGHSGAPVLVFPTSKGRFFEYEDRGMINALSYHIENGWIQVFCVDSIDADSWYNYGAHPAHRAWMHVCYDNYILNEVIPFIRQKAHNDYLIAHGCSFGGYHAANFGLKYPWLVKSIVALGGIFDIHDYVMGFWDDNCYFNSPNDFISGLNGEQLEGIKQQKIILGTGEHDMCRGYNEQLASKLYDKGIWYKLDVWSGVGHDWPWWQEMAKLYLKP